MPPTVFKTPELISLALETYAQSTSYVEAAKKIGVSHGSLFRLLKKHGVVLHGKPGPKNKIPFNEHYFDNIDTEAKAYWLGFIYADGCVRQHSNGSWVFSLLLGIEDKEHLDNFARDIGLDLPHVKIKKGGAACAVVLVRKSFAQALISKGVVPNKTYLGLVFPDFLGLDLTRHFLRGFLDGDGCWMVHHKNAVCSFISKRLEFLVSLRDHLVLHAGVRSVRVAHVPKDDEFRITWEGNVQGRKLIPYFYEEATVFLRRKLHKALAGVTARPPRSKFDYELFYSRLATALARG